MNRIWEYLRTILLTILAAFILLVALLFVIQYQVYNEETKKQVQEDTIDYALIGVLIEKNKYFESQNPTDYKINLKLGTLYEIQKKYPDAEMQYREAINKAPYAEYKPVYKLALLYLFLNRLNEAQALMDNLGEKPNKKLIKYKAEIYSKLGDKYYSKGDYEEASEKYQKSLSYLRIIKSDKEQLIKGSLASAYIYLADENVKQMEIEDAIKYLNRAKSLINAPIIKYKLALLLTRTDPNLAYRYFDEVFETAPEIIDYEGYSKFLSYLVTEAANEGDNMQAELYKFKIKELKKYYDINILSVEDLSIEYIKGEIHLNNWRNKYKINLECRFKNVSKATIDSLYLHVVFKDKDKIIDTYSQRIIDNKSLFKPGAESPVVNIKISTKRTKEDKFPKEINAQIYVSKSEKSYKLLLKEGKIVEKPKEKIYFTLFHRKFALPSF